MTLEQWSSAYGPRKKYFKLYFGPRTKKVDIIKI